MNKHIALNKIRTTIAGSLLGAMAFLALGASPAHAVTGSTGLHYRSNATCKAISSPVVASQDQIVANAPSIYAVNSTSGLDAEYVAFRQRLVKWNGSAWVNTGSMSAWWTGFATDQKAALDFSDGSRTLRMPVLTFTTGPGYYAVVTDYSFGATSTTNGGTDAAFAYHTPSSNTSYCGFSY